MRIVLAGLVLGLLGGCVGGPAPQPDYFLLTAQAAPVGNSHSGLALGVGPVRIAPFLDRAPIVTHDAAGAVRWRDSRRWAEPLDQGIQRVLVQNLEVLTGAHVRNFPWNRAGMPQFALRVDVLDLNRTSAGEAVLEVNWALEDLAQRHIVDGGHDIFTVYGIGASAGEMVEAYSALLARLAARATGHLPPTRADGAD